MLITLTIFFSEGTAATTWFKLIALLEATWLGFLFSYEVFYVGFLLSDG